MSHAFIALILGVTCAQTADDARDRASMERFLAILEKAPRRGTALDRVYGYHVERGSLDAFVKTYQDRVAAAPRDGNGWLLLGLIEAQRGRDAAAVEAFRRAEEARDDDPLPCVYLGQTLVLIGRPDAAAEALERAIARKPGRAELLDVYQALGRIYQRTQRPDKALAVWDRLEKTFPDDARVQEQIAAALAEEADPSRALPRYEALARKARDPYRQVQFGIDAAELKARLGRSAEALRDFEGLLGKLNPESWLHREVRRKVEEVFLKTDDQPGLAAYYEAWTKAHPEDVDALSMLARSQASLGRVAEARATLDRAVALAPTRKGLRLALIEQLKADRKYAEAALQYERLAKAEPTNPDLIREWGRLILRDENRAVDERRAAASEVWNRLLAARPDDPSTLVQVAELTRQAELVDRAIDLYKRAVALAPDAPQYREYLGEYYHTLKRPKDALATFAAIASGKARGVKSLGRLAEVLAGFGYKAEALDAATAAVKLAPDDFDLGYRRASLLASMDRPAEALTQLDLLAPLADSEEQAESVLVEQVKLYASTNRLEAIADALAAELRAGKASTTARWRRLARLDEARQRTSEAVVDIKEALKLDPRSVPAWVDAARIHEAAGGLGDAANAARTLADLDRRSRAEHLKRVATLEGRLGRIDEAMKAGRDLLAASPGNPESYQFFANLCFQVGQTEEGLDALRRAVRANPADTKATLALAESLAEQFRTEEAIELFWRAFDRAEALDAKLAAVSRLTAMYLQRNQFDRLIARLELQGREANAQRDASLCLAQAYGASGDYGAARQTLEKLLATNARDAGTASQLAGLAEAEGDYAAAARYQKLFNELSPGDEGRARLAQLYLKAGEVEEAEAAYAGVAGDRDADRVVQAVDALLAVDKPAAALAIAERRRQADPRDWEFLYRSALALRRLGRVEEAEARFAQLQAVPLPDESPSVRAAARRAAFNAARTGQAATRQLTVQAVSIAERHQVAGQAYATAGILGPNSSRFGNATTWTPIDLGQARLVATAVPLVRAVTEDRLADFLKRRRDARTQSPADPLPWRQCYEHALMLNQGRDAFEAASLWAARFPSDADAQWSYLHCLPSRALPPGQMAAGNGPASAAEDDGKLAPLPREAMDAVLKSYRYVKQRRPEWVEASTLLTVAAELRRSGRTAEYDRFYRDAVASADTVDAVNHAMQLAAERGDVEASLALFDRYGKLQGGRTTALIGGVYDPIDALPRVMNARCLAGAHADALRILDHYLDALARRGKPKAGKPRAALFTGQNGNAYQIWIGSQLQNVQVDFPAPNDYHDYGAITLIRAAFEHYKRADLLSDLTEHFRSKIGLAEARGDVGPRLVLAYLDWWDGRPDPAVAGMVRAAEINKDDVGLRLDLAELSERRGRAAEALAAADAVEPLDNATMQRRENLALRLAVGLGNAARAKQAAERLFNLRLDTQAQVNLAAQMHQLKLPELADALLARARKRAGNNNQTLANLMIGYQRQGKPELAAQVARQLLRKIGVPRQATGTAGVFRNNQNPDANYRAQAMQVLAGTGRLDELTAHAEAQAAASPKSVALLETLADYHRAAGQADKAREVVKRMAAARPDDTRLAMAIVSTLINDGQTDAALDLLRASLARDPSLLAAELPTVWNLYTQAGKLDEFLGLLDQADWKTFGANVGTLSALVTQQLNADATRDAGLKRLRRAQATLPELRPVLSLYLANVAPEAATRIPEVYDAYRAQVVPGPDRVPAPTWHGVDSLVQWWPDGRIDSRLSRLLDVAGRQGRLDTLAADLRAALARDPAWHGGRATLAALKARAGDVVGAHADMLKLLDEHKADPIPLMPAWVLGLEFEDYALTRPVALALYEQTQGARPDPSMGQILFTNTPAKRLSALYRRDGRIGDAAGLVARYLDRKPTGEAARAAAYAGDFGFQRLADGAQQYFELGLPAEAVRVYTGARDDPAHRRALQAQPAAMQVLDQQATFQVGRARKALKPENASATLGVLARPGGPTIDLAAVVLRPAEVGRVAVVSLFEDALTMLKKDDPAVVALRAEVARRVEAAPEDLDGPVAEVLLAIDAGDRAGVESASKRLAERVDRRPPEELGPEARPNARQRAEAQPMVALWLAARALARRSAVDPTADRLAARALEAARRQADDSRLLAMEREWGQIALDAGDPAEADRRWGAMLDRVVGQRTVGREPVAADASSKMAGPATPRSFEGGLPSPAALPRALGLSRLFAENRRIDLSLRAARAGLRGNAPTAAVDAGMAVGGFTTTRRVTFTDTVNRAAGTSLDAQLAALEPLWVAGGAPASAIYEVYREAVLPEFRRAHVSLSPSPMTARPSRRPPSAGRSLVAWAARSGRVEDLRRHIEARKGSPTAELPALVLDGLIGLELNDEGLVERTLSAFEERLKRDPSAAPSELACHVALPAIERLGALGAHARSLLAMASKGLVNPQANGPGEALPLLLARDRYDHRDIAEARADLDLYVDAIERTAKAQYNGDYPALRRRQALRQAAVEAARGGDLDAALDRLGRAADTPIGALVDDASASPVAPTLRLIATLPAARRHDLLKAWALPAREPRVVRSLATGTAPEEPPAEFGVVRLSIGPGGVAGTSGLLLASAREVGRLDALIAEVSTLAASKVDGAEPLQALALLAAGRGGEALGPIRRLREATQERWKPPARGAANRANGFLFGGNSTPVKPVDWAVVEAACAATADPSTAAEARAILGLVRDHALGANDSAAEIVAQRALAGPPVPEPELGPWRASGLSAAGIHRSGSSAPIWAAQGGLIGHATGPDSGAAYFLPPVAGTFTFEVDAYANPGAAGAAYAGYGGLQVEAGPPPVAGAVVPVSTVERLPRPSPIARRDAFNRHRFEVEPGRFRAYLNGHLVHDDKSPGTAFPFLSLNARRGVRTAWRDPRISGTPTIPREVKLLSTRLDGWVASYHKETRPPRFGPAAPDDGGNDPPPEDPGDLSWPMADFDDGQAPAQPAAWDWSVKAGTLEGRRAPAPADATESRIYYARPLADGESVAFEFRHVPGEVEVAPSLGRTAFVLTPGGVKLHWITDGEGDATGLPTDNLADDPRGAGPLPLKINDWNAATLALAGGEVVLTLNGREIARRPAGEGDDRHFGLFHHKDRTAVNVRNIVLRGPWPEVLAAALLAAPAAASDAPDPAARARTALIGEKFFALGAGDQLAKARERPAADAYALLSRYVLPSADHANLRLYGEATPGDPAPPVAGKPEIAPGPRRVHTGGAMRFPAVELARVAKELGKLDELAARVDAIEAKGDAETRAKLAMTAVVRAAQGKDAEAEAALKALRGLQDAIAGDVPELGRWPEFAAAVAALDRPALLVPATAILDAIVSPKQAQGDRRGPWEHPIRHYRAVAQTLARPEADRRPFGTPYQDAEWASVTQVKASTRGEGDPSALWTLKDGEATHYAGHGHAIDSLYYAVPLRGDFEVHADLTSFDYREARLAYNGLAVGVQYDLKRHELYQFGRGLPQGTIDPPLKDIGAYYPFKLVVKDNMYTTYVGDRKIFEQRLPADPDPWLSLGMTGICIGGAKNVRITGNPTIPESLDLSHFADLTGWSGDYYDEPIAGDLKTWEKRGEEIIGRNLADEAAPPDSNQGRFFNGNAQRIPPKVTPGSKIESLLQYHRPMLEDGQIAYEFYYEPGKAMTHPSLDRLVFMIDPKGPTKVHWRTDAQHDRTGLAPDNLADEPDRRRGPAEVNLKPNAWNSAKLAVVGDAVTLTINDVLIYERPIEPTNQRVFGLFHYADEGEVRVRNVTYKGSWPRSLPATQGLAVGK